MIQTYQKVEELENAILANKTILEMIYDAAAANLAKYPEKEEEIKKRYEERIKLFESKVNSQVNLNFICKFS